MHTPRLELWSHVIDFASRPKKAFATPFAMTDDIFIQKCSLVDGMFIDRYRILSGCGNREDWLSRKLNKNLINWVRPKIRTLPRRESD